MKIEFDIKDIGRDEVVDAMAHSLLHRWSDDDGDSPSDLGRSLGNAVKAKIDEVARELVRQHFDDVIRDRIASAVDAVLTEGWYENDGYGGRRGERIDLKARINAALTAPRGDSYHRQPSLLQERLDAAAKSMLDKEFGKIAEDAKAKLRQQLDGAVLAKVAETIKTAIGLR